VEVVVEATIMMDNLMVGAAEVDRLLLVVGKTQGYRQVKKVPMGLDMGEAEVPTTTETLEVETAVQAL
jgi:hypothetical protein